MFDVEKIEQGVEVSIGGDSHDGACYTSGTLVRDFILLRQQIDDLTGNLGMLRDKILEEARPQWAEAQVGKDEPCTKIPVSDDTGSEIALVVSKVKPILPQKGKKVNPAWSAIHKMTGDDPSSCYKEVLSYAFTLDAVPAKKRQMLRDALEGMGIRPNAKLVPLEHMHKIGQVPTSCGDTLTAAQQLKVESELDSRTYSLKIK